MRITTLGRNDECIKLEVEGSEIIALGQGIELTKTSLMDAQKAKISKLVIYDKYENFEYKKLTFYQKIDHSVYEISLLKTSKEYDDFEASITQAILLPLYIVLTLLSILSLKKK